MVYAGDNYRGDGGHLAVLFDIFPLSGEGRTGLNFDGKKVLTLFILILSIAYPFYDMVYDINRGNKSQLDKINYVLNLTGPDDYVYDGDIQFNLFRKDLDYYWFSLGEYGALATHQKLDRYDYNVYDLIGRYKPIIISDFLLDRTNQVIVDQYTVSAGYPDLLIRND